MVDSPPSFPSSAISDDYLKLSPTSFAATMDCQTSQTNVLCTNGYYGYQPPAPNGGSSSAEPVGTYSNGHGSWHGSAALPVLASVCALQRKRPRDGFGNGDTSEESVHNGMAAKVVSVYAKAFQKLIIIRDFTALPPLLYVASHHPPRPFCSALQTAQ